MPAIMRLIRQICRRAARVAGIAIIPGLLATAPYIATAHDTMLGPLVIEGLSASAAPSGASSRLSMRIANAGYDDLHLLDVSSPVARSTTLTFHGGPGESARLDSIRLSAQELTDIGSNHLWIHLVGLRKALLAGDEVPFKLHFANGHQVTLHAVVAEEPLDPAS